jgi:DNA-binding transcriptional regulator YiaG
MANIAIALRDEISRLARKEIRNQIEPLRKASAEYRKRIAEMKRQVSELQRKVTSLEKQLRRDIPFRPPKAVSGNYRFSAKGLRSNRERLGLSAADFGKLIGVTGQTVYKWEQEASRPREKQLAALAAVRGMGKRDAAERLEEMSKASG